MNKKKDYEKIYAEIREKFPGQVVKRIGKNGGNSAYHFTREQSQWFMDNSFKVYPISNIAKALGISEIVIERDMARHDLSMLQRLSERRKSYYDHAKARREGMIDLGNIVHIKHKKVKHDDEPTAESPTSEEDKEKAKRKKKEKQILSAYDEMLKKEERDRKRREKKAALEEQKRKMEDAAYAAECLKRFPEDRKRKPLPFTQDQTNVRFEMRKRGYILPEGDELLGDNRTNVYWDSDTRRSMKIEERAIRYKLSVIKYSDMFPDMSNRMSSCKADCAQRDFYKMN